MTKVKEFQDTTQIADEDTLKIRLAEAKATSPVLVVISGRPLGKSFYLTQPSCTLGRDLTAELCIAETSISRRHTEFIKTEEGVQVCDLGSTNGTYLNDQRLEAPTLLKDGDLVRCGNTILKFLSEGKIENLHYGKMYDLATRDDLTKALNKKAILDLIKEEFAKAQFKGNPFTILFCDLDHFKKINDTYGHLAGDFVLKETSHLIQTKVIRSQDALGRYGGEEFCLVLVDTPLQTAADVGERIRMTIEKHKYEFEDKTIPVTMSLGVATLDSTTKTPEDLLDAADKALYDAKNQGRNRVCIR